MVLMKGTARLTMGYMIPLTLIGVWGVMDYFQRKKQRNNNTMDMLTSHLANQIKGWSTITVFSIVSYSAMYGMISGWTLTGFSFSMAWNRKRFTKEFAIGSLWEYDNMSKDNITTKI